MSSTTQQSSHNRWARFRFAVIGPLLAAPPISGELQTALNELAAQTYRHPLDGTPMTLGRSTLERWFYCARNASDPMAVLRPKPRHDAGRSRVLSESIKALIQTQHRQHPAWSYQLHHDNIKVLIQNDTDLGPIPSYSTVRRHMKARGLVRRRGRRHDTEGGRRAEQRLEQREVRSYEMEHVNALWHLDFHHGSRQILGVDGQWRTPLLLAIMDDRSRLIAHAQWYLDETTQSLVHGFSQALLKRGLPRALMSDNGAAMTSAEFVQGLERLSILHQPTLPYSPYQNAKQEVFRGQVEGRLIAMLEGENDRTLRLLNDATQAWIELEYHRKVHSELACSPLDRFLEGPDVARPRPDSATAQHAFRQQVQRKQRRSDGTLVIDGVRFEIPANFRHIEHLQVRYARWDLQQASLIDPRTNHELATIYPLNKTANSSGLRRVLRDAPDTPALPPAGIAPLLKELMQNYSATGLPPAYLPIGDPQ